MTTPVGPVIEFEIAGSHEKLVLSDYRALVAGYTGRDREAVQRHIDELAEIGIPPPASVPAYFPIDPALVTQDRSVMVAGTNTSGEVEPVLVRCDSRLYLAVGSDHTDRDIERDDIARSKQSCPKPVSRQIVRLPDVGRFDWDRAIASCRVDGRPYQRGSLSALRDPVEVLTAYDDLVGESGDVLMFGGTLPLTDGEFVAGARWDLSLQLPAGAELTHSYEVTVINH